MIAVLVWIPLAVSAVLIAASWMAYWTVGAGSARTLGVLTAWFLVAFYLQFFSDSMSMTTVGLVLQTLLAVTLVLRAKVQSG